MRWQFAVNPLHNCSLRPFCDDCSLNSFRTRCIPFLSLYRASLRVDEIRRNELSRFYFQPPAFPHAIFPIFPVSLGSLFSLFSLFYRLAYLLLPDLSRRVFESVREETRTIFALGKDCSNHRFVRHSVGNCAKLGPSVSQGLSRL